MLYSQIENKQFFESTEALEFSWQLDGDGHNLGDGILDLPLIEPQSCHTIYWEEKYPWFSLWETSSAAEIFLTVTVKQKHSTRWVKEGHVVSSTQHSLPKKREGPSHVSAIMLLVGFGFIL